MVYKAQEYTLDDALDELVIRLEETIGTSPHSRETIKDFFKKAIVLYKKDMAERSAEIDRRISLVLRGT